MGLKIPGVPDFAEHPAKWLAAKKIVARQGRKLFGTSILDLTVQIYRRLGGSIKSCKMEDYKNMAEEYEAEMTKTENVTPETEAPTESPTLGEEEKCDEETKEVMKPADPEKPYKPIDSIGLYGRY